MEKYLRIQASIFGNFKDIDLSQESMRKLYDIYLNKKLMPSIIRELDPLSQNIINRPSFVAQDNSISISIGTNRIDVVTDASAGDSMLDKSTFIDKACEYIGELFDVSTLGVSRMSFITEGIVRAMQSCEIEPYMNKYLNKGHVYNSEKIFEWSCNNVSLDQWTINNRTEDVNLNITTAVRRINALKNDQPVIVNGLVLTQDLNTLAENTLERMTIQDITAFLKIANDKSDIIRQVIEKE